MRISVFSLFLLASLGRVLWADGLHREPPVIDAFHSVSVKAGGPSLLTEKHPRLLVLNTSIIEDTQVTDFEQRAVYFERREKSMGIIIWQYRFSEMDAYIANREDFAFEDLWYSGMLSVASSQKAVDKKKNFSFLQLELPVQYPSWAQRILGKDPPRLSISGYEEVDVGYEYNKTDAVGSNYQSIGVGGINFDQNNEFTVNGSVGKVINVNIKASTKQGIDASDANDPLKNFHIDYKGEGNELEDEVVQQVSAGAMSFSMPGTELSGYSESHDGLIGIQVKSKFGPLELTSIASEEHGQSQTQSFNLTGSGAGVTTYRESNLLPNKMFFLDTVYLDYYLTSQAKRANVPPPPVIDSLQVWINNTAVQTAIYSAQKVNNTYCRIGSGSGPAYQMLVLNRDYVIDKVNPGCIHITDSLTIQDADQLGIFMKTEGTRIPRKGSPYSAAVNDTTTRILDTLWTLKAQNPSLQYNPSTFSLMWPNVYRMPSTNVNANTFQIKAFMVPPSGGDTATVNGGSLFTYILGVTDNKGVALITNSQIFDLQDKLLIMPPFDTGGPLMCNRPFVNPSLGVANRDDSIYLFNQSDPNFALIKPLYTMTMTGSSQQTTFTLGNGNIMESSEIVKGNDGEKLVRDQDYTLDYQMGQLALISKKALSKTRIDVQYQSEAVFVAQSKVFLGVHGEMKLPFGPGSMVGGSLMYQNAAASNANIPQIGQEPYSKILMDVNTKLNFEPDWMTAVINKLPLISTEDKSTASLNIEVAHSISNPNTDGQAYIDNFESSTKTYALGLDQRSWYQAGPPNYLTGDSLLKCPPAWISYWYQPVSEDSTRADHEILRATIFKTVPPSDAQSATDKYEPVLSFNCAPVPLNAFLTDPDHQWLHPWAGIMYPLPASSTNRSKDKYFEFWANGKNGGGRLYVDMGTVNEDLCYEGGPPNGKLDAEDTAGLGIYDSSEDKGLDGVWDKDEYYLVPNLTTHAWDTLRYGDTRLNDSREGNRAMDPSRDNYQTYNYLSQYENNFPFVNGTEKSGTLNTEALTSDGLITNESYFRRFIDFDSMASQGFMTKNANNYMVPDSVSNALPGSGWHLYRIPLNDAVTGMLSIDSTGGSGAPQWSQIKFIRLFWTNLENRKTQLNQLQFARMNLVRNDWQVEPNVVVADSGDTATVVKLDATSINTQDNPSTYIPPPGIVIQKDAQGYPVKESSLDLTFTNILPGDTAHVDNFLVNQTLNLSIYQSLSMDVHGDVLLGNKPDLHFFFRFGTDNSTYYEYRTPIYPGWDQRNYVQINLRDLSNLKLSEMTPLTDTASNVYAYKNFGTYSISIKYSNQRPPNFSAITWMSMGVIRDGTPTGSRTGGYSGSIWTDELKVSGVHQFNGWAARADVSSNWGGFLNLSGNMNYRDGNFQQMTETQNTLGTSSLSNSVSGSINMSKLLPQQWGINIPLGASLSGNLNRPSLVSNTDIYLTNQSGSADAIGDMYAAALNMMLGRNFLPSPRTAAVDYQSGTVSKTFYTSFDKTTVSKNPFVDFLLDRLSLDYKYSYNLSLTAKGQNPNNPGSDFIDSTITSNYSGAIKYDLTPRPAPEWTKWKPFAGLKLSWLPDRLKNLEMSLLPSTLNFNLANIQYINTQNSLEYEGSSINTKTLSLSHGATLAYNPLNILNLNYSLNINRSLDKDVNDTAWNRLGFPQRWRQLASTQIFKCDPVWKDYYILAGEQNRTQNTSLKFDPTLWDWLTTSATYNAAYSQSASTLSGDSTEYENLGIASTFHLTSTLTLASMFKKFSEGFSGTKALGAAFGSIGQMLDKMALNSVNFDYNASVALTNNNVSVPLLQRSGVTGIDFFRYQLGYMKGRTAWDILTGNMPGKVFGGINSRYGDYSAYTGQALYMNDNQKTDRSFSLSTSFNLPAPLSINLSSIGLKWSQTISEQADSVSPPCDTTTIYPDFNVGVTSQILNKIPFFNKYIDQASLSSNFNFQQKIDKNYQPDRTEFITSLAHTFSPLVGIDGQIKKSPIKFSYKLDYSTTSNSSSLNGMTKDTKYTNNITLNYEMQKSPSTPDFKFLFWTVPLRGTFSVGLTGEQGAEVTDTKTSDSGAQDQATYSSHYAFGPTAKYSFSDNITGMLTVSITQKKDQSVTTTQDIFKLSVNVALK